MFLLLILLCSRQIYRLFFINEDILRICINDFFENILIKIYLMLHRIFVKYCVLSGRIRCTYMKCTRYIFYVYCSYHLEWIYISHISIRYSTNFHKYIYIYVCHMYAHLMYIHGMYKTYILCILHIAPLMNIHITYIHMIFYECLTNVYIPVYSMYVHDKYMLFFSHYRHSMYIHRISNVY